MGPDVAKAAHRGDGGDLRNSHSGRGDGSEHNAISALPQENALQPKFNYAALAPADAASLREQAVRIRGLITKSTADMIAIGRDLIAIKTHHLNHGQFTDWLEHEIGVGIRTAQVYMAIAKRAEGKNETIALLPPSTARMLAAKSAPPEIVEQVITQAAAGIIMPDRIVKDMISETRAWRRHQKLIELNDARKARRPRAVREREKRQRLEYEAERERERAEDTARAQSILDRLSPEDVRFLAETLTWDVYEEFRRLVGEGGAA
jgi:hypothetical protein